MTNAPTPLEAVREARAWREVIAPAQHQQQHQQQQVREEGVGWGPRCRGCRYTGSLVQALGLGRVVQSTAVVAASDCDTCNV